MNLSSRNFLSQPCRLLESKALCSKNKIFTTQLYSVWRITCGSKTVLVNYAVGGWKHFCEKYNIFLHWPSLDFQRFIGSSTQVNQCQLCPSSLPSHFNAQLKRKLRDSFMLWMPAWTVPLHAWISMLFSLKKHVFTHRILLSQRREVLNFCQVSVSKSMSCNKGLSFYFRSAWTGCISQILKGVCGWHFQHQHTLKSISPECILQIWGAHISNG